MLIKQSNVTRKMWFKAANNKSFKNLLGVAACKAEASGNFDPVPDGDELCWEHLLFYSDLDTSVCQLNFCELFRISISDLENKWLFQCFEFFMAVNTFADIYRQLNN